MSELWGDAALVFALVVTKESSNSQKVLLRSSSDIFPITTQQP